MITDTELVQVSLQDLHRRYNRWLRANDQRYDILLGRMTMICGGQAIPLPNLRRQLRSWKYRLSDRPIEEYQVLQDRRVRLQALDYLGGNPYLQQKEGGTSK